MAKTKNIDRSLILKKIKDEQKSRPEKKNITFNLDESLINKFRKDCKSQGCSMNEVINYLIRAYLDLE